MDHAHIIGLGNAPIRSLKDTLMSLDLSILTRAKDGWATKWIKGTKERKFRT